jgi:NTP pyrophosphatase (non-canonical NTP hydrolase)
MELNQLSERAMEIRRRYGALEQATRGREWTREELMQGFVGDVGDLMKLVMAKSGLRPLAEADRRIAHELADCLWSVLVLARLYGVDLEREFLETMSEIEESIGIQLSGAGGRLPAPDSDRLSGDSA